MDRKHRSNPRDIVLGPLPVDAINKALGLELERGNLILKFAAQVHANKRHPKEYASIFPKLTEVLSNCLYVGDDHKNHDKFELIGKIHELNQFILIAITITIDEGGNYRVASFYPVAKDKIQKRREKGYLKIMT